MGQVAARRFAGQGVQLVLLGRNTAPLEDLVSELNLPDDRYLVDSADLTNPETTKSAADRAIEKFGRIDILVHLVGGYTGGEKLVDVPVIELRNMLAQHVWTTFNVIQVFGPSIESSEQGSAVIVSNPYALSPRGRTPLTPQPRPPRRFWTISGSGVQRDRSHRQRCPRPRDRCGRGPNAFFEKHQDDPRRDHRYDPLPLFRRNSDGKRSTHPPLRRPLTARAGSTLVSNPEVGKPGSCSAIVLRPSPVASTRLRPSPWPIATSPKPTSQHADSSPGASRRP